jgi:putative transposase
LLKAGRLSWHKTKKANPKKDEQKIIEKREEIKKKLNSRSQEIKDKKLVVLMEDESHLIWGDACGLIWGKTNEKVEIPMTNFRDRQTYYGAINIMSKEFHIQAYSSGNGANTVDFVKKLQKIYQGAKLLFIWDGASYHKYSQMRDYLIEINKGLDENDWPVTCMLFAPNAPEQNPVEDIWLKGKNWIRKHFIENKTFAQVKQSFLQFLSNRIFDFQKFAWYNCENLQLI